LPKEIYYIQHGEDPPDAPQRRPRPAAELEVRPGRSLEDQIGIVVAALLDDEKGEALDTMKTTFAKVITEIRAWEVASKARLLNDDQQEATPEGGDLRPATSTLPSPCC
jgi:replication fork protection complex subunit Tof1/Swi1